MCLYLPRSSSSTPALLEAGYKGTFCWCIASCSNLCMVRLDQDCQAEGPWCNQGVAKLWLRGTVGHTMCPKHIRRIVQPNEYFVSFRSGGLPDPLNRLPFPKDPGESLICPSDYIVCLPTTHSDLCEPLVPIVIHNNQSVGGEEDPVVTNKASLSCTMNRPR